MLYIVGPFYHDFEFSCAWRFPVMVKRSHNTISSVSGLTGKDRVEFIRSKCSEYEILKHQWIELVLQGRMTDDLKYLTNMVKKDVLRTDRHLPFYSGDGNSNVNILYNILTTYALNHPIVGYCQACIAFIPKLSWSDSAYLLQSHAGQ